jgi:hypothetical protein
MGVDGVLYFVAGLLVSSAIHLLIVLILIRRREPPTEAKP